MIALPHPPLSFSLKRLLRFCQMQIHRVVHFIFLYDTVCVQAWGCWAHLILVFLSIPPEGDGGVSVTSF